MREFFRRNGRKKLVDWLALDSWLDSSLYESWESWCNLWASYSSFFGRFRVTGFNRVATEFASESLTLGTAGSLVLLTLALPAFEETTQDWQATGKYSVTFLDRFGNEIGNRGILHDDAVPLAEIPDVMIKATLATEDRRFYDHFGIDVVGTFRAMVENVRANTVVQGGSSITQQLAKNLFLSSERSLKRKIKEAFLAIWLESRLTKKEILKLYLDRAYMGGGTFGVEAASQYYFNKSVRDINLAEAAMLAGLFKAPTKFAPHVDLAASRARANEVLTNMVEAGFMTEGQVHGARLNPAKIIQRQETANPDWFLDWAFEEVKRLMKDKSDYVLTVQTTVDPELQAFATSAMNTILSQHGRAKRTKQGALVSMEIDGAVRAIVGGRDYGESQFNRATNAKRQPGSSFKPYVYFSALLNGVTPYSIVNDSHRPCGGRYFKNYSGGYRGRMTVADALMRSINTVALELSYRVGREKVLAFVKKLGIKGVKKSCTMALGDTGIPPLMHTTGYAHFASGGKSVEAYGILEIRNSAGTLIYSHEKDGYKPKQILNADKVKQLNFMLHRVITSGTGKRAQLDFTLAAGKTGTSSNYRDAWFMGYTGKYVTGVWFGNDDYRPTGGVTGGNMPAMAWKLYMTAAHAKDNVPPIPGVPLHPNQRYQVQPVAQPKSDDNKVKTLATRTRHLSQQTRKTLQQISKLMKEAASLKEASKKGQDQQKLKSSRQLAGENLNKPRPSAQQNLTR